MLSLWRKTVRDGVIVGQDANTELRGKIGKLKHLSAGFVFAIYFMATGLFMYQIHPRAMIATNQSTATGEPDAAFPGASLVALGDRKRKWRDERSD